MIFLPHRCPNLVVFSPLYSLNTTIVHPVGKKWIQFLLISSFTSHSIVNLSQRSLVFSLHYPPPQFIPTPLQSQTISTSWWSLCFLFPLPFPFHLSLVQISWHLPFVILSTSILQQFNGDFYIFLSYLCLSKILWGNVVSVLDNFIFRI